jgi:hypothetical protein
MICGLDLSIKQKKYYRGHFGEEKEKAKAQDRVTIVPIGGVR